MKRFGKIVVKNKVLIMIVALLLLIPSAIGYIGTDINYDILVYMPDDIETMKGEKSLSEDFDMGAFSIVAVDNMSSKDMIKLEKKFLKIKGVNTAISANDLIGTTIPLEMLPDDVVSSFHKDGTDLMLVKFDDSTIAVNAVKQMRTVVKDNVKIGGMSASNLDTSILCDQELPLYVLIAVACCLLVLTISLDSYLVPFLLLANIGIAIIYNLGSNIMFGQISYITKAIAAVLQLGVTTDFSIFLYHKYERAKQQYSDKNEAMAFAINETLISVTGSSLTTIAGFLALCTMQLTIGKDIGLVMAKGVFLGVICTVTIFPSVLLLFDKWLTKTQHKPLVPQFKAVQGIVTKHYKVILLIGLVLVLPAVYGNNNVKSYYNITATLPQTLDSAVANNEVKDKFDMVASQVILVDKDMTNEDMTNMCDEIKSLKNINMVLAPSQLSDLNIPEDEIPSSIKKIYESDKYKMIFVNSTDEIATDALNKQISKIHKIVKSYDKTALLAGEGPAMSDMVSIAATDFSNVSVASIAAVFIIMIFVLKSGSLPVLLVAGIELAIFINMAVAFYTNTTLPFIASIVIGTIQLGATIDYAILLTTKFLERRRLGMNKIDAMKIALDHSVNSIFVSACCFFAATYGVGLVSKLSLIGSLCTLMSRGAIISMIIAIFLIPSILLVFDKLICKTTKGMKNLPEYKGEIQNEEN